jgi:Asp-tRNA(Asn)/Glu-tRNA(Gln) amidotransferase A subunit family amidase
MTVAASRTASDLVGDIRAGRLSSAEVTEVTLRAIDESNSQLHAFLAVGYEQALERAAEADAAHATGRSWGALHGLPVAVKDLHETRDLPTSFGAVALREHRPEHDAIIVERLRRAGAIIVAKTNTPAFGALGETKNRLGDDCRNPHRLELTPGGSSGGSAAAVAKGVVALATGSDSAGSIACPAAFCGIVGMKPTRGVVPHWPAVDDSLLLNHSGPLATCVADVRLMLETVAGPDPRDPMAAWAPPLAPAGAGARRRLRIAYTPDFGYFPVDDELRDAVEGSLDTLRALAEVERAEPEVANPLDVYMPIYVADFHQWSRTADPRLLDELFAETVAELQEHTPRTDADHARALSRVWRFVAELDRFFERFDFLVSPATATAAFPVREPPDRIGGRTVRPGWQSFMPFQVPWNLGGHPTMCVPAGQTPDGRPVGLLIAARRGRDRALLELAEQFEINRGSERLAAHPSDGRRRSPIA